MTSWFILHGRSCSASLHNSLVGHQRPCYFVVSRQPFRRERMYVIVQALKPSKLE